MVERKIINKTKIHVQEISTTTAGELWKQPLGQSLENSAFGGCDA